MLIRGQQRRVRVYLYPTDMRKQFNGLSALVISELGEDLLSGDAFLFVSRNRKLAKILLWDGTGLCVFAKRLESGRFTAPWALGDGSEAVTMTASELQLFLDGTELIGRLPLSPPPWTPRAPKLPAQP
jgi:transposase